MTLNQAELVEPSKADWEQRWKLRHPKPDWRSPRHSTIKDICDYLHTSQGYLGSITMCDAPLRAHVNTEDIRDSSWWIDDGILPTEYDSICSLLSESDDESIGFTKEELIGATLTTVLHLRGVADPIALVDRMREEFCFVDSLDNISTHAARAGRDTWDIFAQVAESFADRLRFDAEFPPSGPSGEFCARLLSTGWLWRDIMQRARTGGYAGKKHALEARVHRVRHSAERRKRNDQPANRQQSGPLSQSEDAREVLKPADRIARYLRQRSCAVSVALIAVNSNLDEEQALKELGADPSIFAAKSDGTWTLIVPPGRPSHR